MLKLLKSAAARFVPCWIRALFASSCCSTSWPPRTSIPCGSASATPQPPNTTTALVAQLASSTWGDERRRRSSPCSGSPGLHCQRLRPAIDAFCSIAPSTPANQRLLSISHSANCKPGNRGLRRRTPALICSQELMKIQSAHGFDLNDPSLGCHSYRCRVLGRSKPGTPLRRSALRIDGGPSTSILRTRLPAATMAACGPASG